MSDRNVVKYYGLLSIPIFYWWSSSGILAVKQNFIINITQGTFEKNNEKIHDLEPHVESKKNGL